MIENPFIISGYVPDEYFCDRESETEELIGAMLNGRNTVLVSPRRMGKTGLIEHCFHQKEIQDRYHTFYVDIYATGTLRELVFVLGKHIFDTLKPRGRRFIDKFFAVIASLRPAFKLDAVSGEPVFDIGIGEIRHPELSLEEIFRYLESADKRCLVAIDEFQQIARYPEKNIEAVLRTYIQRCRNTTFIFSGSQRHMMQQIFFSASRPFYQSAGFLNLEAIVLEKYLPFVQRHFTAAGKHISEECIGHIYSLFEGHTWYMQSLLNRLYAHTATAETMSLSDADRILHETVDANRVVFQSIVSVLSERQKELLFAIGKSGRAQKITSAEFVGRHGLKSASSVQSSARQLLDKELITQEGDVYQVYDRFFGLWIAENYGTGYGL